jgi:hypothetical protein
MEKLLIIGFAASRPALRERVNRTAPHPRIIVLGCLQPALIGAGRCCRSVHEFESGLRAGGAMWSRRAVVSSRCPAFSACVVEAHEPMGVQAFAYGLSRRSNASPRITASSPKRAPSTACSACAARRSTKSVRGSAVEAPVDQRIFKTMTWSLLGSVIGRSFFT